jgi:6-pyruvoyltetrahydropterin/6-carboxytetrahydropterin synthase
MYNYRSSKTYGHERGLSCCFRQHKAKSHCSQLHGYALSVHIEFEATELDENNWVVDFGAMKSIKEWLDFMFDHTLIVAEDDPRAVMMSDLLAIAEVRFVPATGCEAFASLIANHVMRWLEENDYTPRVRLHHVEVKEHGANGAKWVADYSEQEWT